ncbi:MAG: ATP-binding protein [Candidatus Saccharimonadales bacterium]
MIASVGLITVAVVSFLLGLMVAAQRPWRSAIVLFFVANMAAAAWSLGLAVFISTSDEQLMLNAANTYYIAAAAIVCAMLLFAMTFTGRTSRMKVASVIMPFIGITIAIIANPNLIVSDVVVSTGTANGATLNMFAYGVYALYFVTYYFATLVIFWIKSRRHDTVLRRHFIHILVAYGVAGVVGMIFNLILPAFGDYSLIWIGPLGMFLFVPIVSVTIARYGLFDIRQAVVRTVAYIMALSMLAAVYYLVAYVASVILFSRGNEGIASVGPLNVLIALVLAFLFQPIKTFFDKITNSLFYRDDYSTDDFFARINRVLTSTTDLRTLLSRTAEEVRSTLKSEQVFLFTYHINDRHISAGTKPHGTFTMSDTKVLEAYVHRESRDLIVTKLLPQGSDIRQVLERVSVALLLPLDVPDKIIGYLALGDRKSGAYSSRDLQAMTTISDGLVIAIQNSLSVQEVKDLNATLHQRIDDATKELRDSNAKLQRLDEAKDEFVSMASHQLRTPLTSVKGYIDMVLDGDAGKITDMQRKLLGEAFTSSERMVHLINDFLNVSRLQTGKFMIDRRKIDLAKLVAQEVRGLQTTAGSRNLKLNYRPPSVFPILYIDEGKLRQVIMNFIDNAFYYSREHSTVTVSLSTVGGEAIMTVKDSGMGVPASEQKHLFTKFFRATNARKQRPDGTGVGLFLAKKVVVAHGGTVIFESEEGKGSTFGFRLPIKKLSLAPADSAN